MPDCVLIVTVVVAAALLVILTGAIVEQVGRSTSPPWELLPLHTIDTLPVKPLVGVTVIVEVPLAPATIVIGVLLNR